MFNKKTNTSGAPADAVRDTVIGAATKGEGTLETAHDVFVAGQFKGVIKSQGTVVVNNTAKVDADVTGKCVVVHGEVTGNVMAHERLEVGATGRIKGDVHAGAARVTEGGQLEGTCVILSGQGKEAAMKTAAKVSGAA